MNTTTKGISRQSNGNWSYRFVIVDQDNVRHDVRKTTDENGHPLTSQKAAIKAKNIELNKWKNKITKITANRKFQCLSVRFFIF